MTILWEKPDNGGSGKSCNELNLKACRLILDVPGCYARLTPDLFMRPDCTEEDRCEWLRSQIVGNDTEFPTPFGKRLLTYSDYTASGRSLLHVENLIMHHVLPYYGNTHTDDTFVGQSMTSMALEAALYVKECMGATDGEAIFFCGAGCTAALKRLQEVMGVTAPSTLRARIISTLQEKERWVVFVGPYEHHSNLLSWRQSLAEVVEIPIDKAGLVDIGKLKEVLSYEKYRGRPKLGSFSACSNVSGIYSDTRAIARLLHEHGAFACFDFASCGPYVQIDMRVGDIEGYDAVVLSPHKFLGGPGSPGILLLSKRLYILNDKPPSTCGGGAVEFVNAFSEKNTIYIKDIEAREDAGTPPSVQKIRAALAFWVKEIIGHRFIEDREQRFIRTAIARLSLHPLIVILGNTSVKRAAILSFLVRSTKPVDSFPNLPASSDDASSIAPKTLIQKGKSLQGRFTVKLLNDLFGIQARGGCVCAGPYGHALLNIDEEHSILLHDAIEAGHCGLRPGWARLCFSYCISNEEFEFILSAIEFIADYGQRFLALYNFDWKTGNWTIRDFSNSVKTVYSTDTQIKQYVRKHLRTNAMHNNRISKANLPVSKNYETYLEVAKRIADGLPEFPEDRAVPDYVNLRLFNFKV
ncbi:hypothetical protein O6H91_21G047700 [Diphasiastrum complanatum]|uniref:Uncharacterized protein n=3 Tax=Diphasiastrum complanatum TaxID=34168 RepID=A0ACC2AKH3_DIPCM|nr:hypothetical protein O6H91_21G047700 [Diphasiastrum complanatum]KAJ7517950.1 hypothetical protein O6H91_21G047700 [Diphasiastrum complanatum]KAJ7517951.1 hypothetical protein O6H91_21G047700 [Diphasiastrum complanatum]